MHYPFKSVGSLADEFRQTDKQQRQSLILDDHPNQSSQVPQIAQPLRMLSPSSLSLWNLGQTALPTICHRAYLPTVHGHKSVVGHIKIGPRSVISARSGVINSLEGGRSAWGTRSSRLFKKSASCPSCSSALANWGTGLERESRPTFTNPRS